MLLRLSTELSSQLRQIATHRELPAVFVNDLEVHEQMRRQRFELEVRLLHRYLRLLANVRDQRFEQTARAERLAAVPLDHAGRELRQGHEMPPQLLRQRLQQQLYFLFQHAANQPLGPACVDLIQAK